MKSNFPINDRFNSIWGEVEPYVTAVCKRFSHSFRYNMVEDLRQECAIKLVVLLRSQDLSDAELVKVFKTSVYNLLRDFHRAYVRTVHPLSTEPLMDENEEEKFVDAGWSEFDELAFRFHVDAIHGALRSELDRAVFRLLLAPDRPLVARAQEEVRAAKLRRQDGQLVMRTEEVVITGDNLARRLSVSPATISRVMKRLRRIMQEVIHARQAGKL